MIIFKTSKIFKLITIFSSAFIFSSISMNALAEPTYTYYFGESKMYIPDTKGEAGKYIGSSESLIKRTEIPEKNIIVEDVVSISKDKAPQEFEVSFNIKNDHDFIMTEKNNFFTGKGSLSGKKWHWSSWDSESIMPDKSKIISNDQITGNNLIVSKKYFSADKKLRIIFKEKYNKINSDEYSERYKTLFPEEKQKLPVRKEMEG